MKTEITKTNANGNNFIIIQNQSYKQFINSNFIKKICKHYSTDGLIIINHIENNDFAMNYFNNDGSWETLCINGLTCSSLLLKKTVSIKKLNIISNNIPYPIEIENRDKVKIKLPAPKYKIKNIKLNNIHGTYIDSGAKHFIIEVKEWINDTQLVELAKKIRYNKEVFPDGTNVNFFKLLNQHTIEVKTYEKGVEKLMDSCASGSYACAYDAYVNKKTESKIIIINPGGKFDITINANTQNYYILNSAVLECSHTIDLSLYA